DRERLERVAQRRAAPQYVSGFVVEGKKLAIERADEDQAASRRESRAGDRRILAVLPNFGLIRQIDGADLTDIAVAVGRRDAGVGLQATAGVDLARIERVPRGVGAEFHRRQVEHVRPGAERGRLPGLAA